MTNHVNVSTSMRLAKLHATGNDFLVRVAFEDAAAELDASTVAALCDRHRGIGADGLITLRPGVNGGDCAMTLVNADGGAAEMSGNGIRCLAWVAASEGIVSGSELAVETAAGVRTIELDRSGSQVVGATVDMGPVTFDPSLIPVAVDDPFDLEAVAGDAFYRGDAAGMGNPHFVLLVDDPASVPVGVHGPLLEHDARFPHRTNVEFVRVLDADRIAMRVWERGAGETMSCGTGACAAAAVAHRRGLVGARVHVDVLGGELTVTLDAKIRLGGPVAHVFDVDVQLDRLQASA